MKAFTIVLISVVVFAFITGCGPKTMKEGPATESAIDQISSEWVKVPNDPEQIYGRGTGRSEDVGLAFDKAHEDGRKNITTTVESKNEVLIDRFSDETGSGKNSELMQQFKVVTKTVASQVSSMVSEYKAWPPVSENGQFRVYLWMHLPLGEYASQMVKQINNNQNMYVRFKATEAYKELDEETKKFEEYKAKQNPQNPQNP